MIPKTHLSARRAMLLLLALLLAVMPTSFAFADLTADEAPVEASSTETAAEGDQVTEEAPATEAPSDGEDLGVIAETGAGEEVTETVAEPDEPAQVDDTQAEATSANGSGPYDPEGVGLPSGNGSGSGGNKPCAGCVGNADGKNPPGQLPGGAEDGNNGYECDTNSGVGKTNPAHSGCKAAVDPDSDISLVKTGPDEAEIDETITYAFDVTNTGDTTLTDVYLTDPLIGGGDITVAPPTLAPGESGKATAQYTVDEADINADDEVHNTATVYGTDPDGAEVTAQDSHVVVVPPAVIVVPKRHTICHATGKPTKFVVIAPSVRGVYNGHLGFSHHQARDIIPPFMYDANGDGVEESYSQNWTAEGQAIFNAGCKAANPPEPQIDLEKSGPDFADPGEVITYRFDVTNTGDVDLTDVHVTDPLLGGAKITVNPPTLEANGGEGVATAQYTIPDDAQPGSTIPNTATATGTPPTGDDVSATDDHLVKIRPETIPKKHTICHATGQPGKFVVISPSVRGVYNGHLGANHHQGRDIIPPFMYDANGDGVEESFSQNWDADGQAIFNAGCKAPEPPPEIDLEKSGPDFASPGEVITYEFDVTNTGDVDLTNVHVTDPLLGGARITVEPSTLEANGGEGVATAEYTIPEDAIPFSTIPNTATATGTSPTGQDVSAIDDHVVTIRPGTPPPPGILLEKDGPVTAEVGSTVVYTFRVTNIGKVTLSNVRVDDPLLAKRSLAVTPSILLPGEVGTASGTYTVTKADQVVGEVVNTATGRGKPPSGPEVNDKDDHTFTVPPPGPRPRIRLDKSGPATAGVGDTITYRFRATNVGNQTLTDVHITDERLGIENLAVTPSTLLPGDSGTATATYTVTDADGEVGRILNTAIVTGTPPRGIPITDTDTHRTLVPGEPDDPDDPDLPATGSNAPTQLLLAALALMMGAGLLLLARRTTPQLEAWTTGTMPARRLSGSDTPPAVHRRLGGGGPTPAF